MQVTNYDVAIVGAGVSGCYVAYRLATASFDDFKPSPLRSLYENGKKPTLGLFEYSGRVGGRLLSPHVEGIPGYRAEFGGFRFKRQMHVVWDTAQHLGLTDEAFPVVVSENLFYVRGRRIQQERFNRGEDVPYNLPPQEKEQALALFPDSPNLTQGLIYLVANTAISEPTFMELRTAYYRAFNAKDWVEVKRVSDLYQNLKQTATVAGRLLSDWSWWALKRYVLSQEAVNLLEDIQGYNTQGFAGNATNSLDELFYFPDTSGPLSDGINTEWRHIKEGYAAIPGRLQVGFEACNGYTHLNHQLLRFDRAEDGDGYELCFYERSAGETITAIEAEDDGDGSKQKTVRAKFLVLAMPKRSIELLDRRTTLLFQKNIDKRYCQPVPKSAVPEPSVQPTVNAELLDTVTNMDAIRIFLAYDYPWWQEKYPELKRGRSTTDLGLRQFYYWFTEPGENGKQGKTLVLASYASGVAERYWRGIQDGEIYVAPGVELLADSAGAEEDPQKKRQKRPLYYNQGGGPRTASYTMAEEAHRQLMEFHGIANAPKPYYAHFQNWTKDPWGAGWHQWKSGQKSDEKIPQVLQPLDDEQIYIVGECWSNVQGWVWGALNTSEAMLQCKLGLKWPQWLRWEGTWLGPGTDWPFGPDPNVCTEDANT